MIAFIIAQVVFNAIVAVYVWKLCASVVEHQKAIAKLIELHELTTTAMLKELKQTLKWTDAMDCEGNRKQ